MNELNERIEAYRASAGELKRLMGLRLAKSEALATAKATVDKLRAGTGKARFFIMPALRHIGTENRG